MIGFVAAVRPALGAMGVGSFGMTREMNTDFSEFESADNIIFEVSRFKF